MPNKKNKQKREHQSIPKQISSSRIEQPSSALQKQRPNKKGRKSIRIVASNDQQQTQMNTDQASSPTNSKVARAHTLSPDKNHAIYKLDPYHMPKIQQDATQINMQSPLQTIGNQGAGGELKKKQSSQNESMTLKGNIYQQKGRPMTGDKNKYEGQQASNLTDSPFFQNCQGISNTNSTAKVQFSIKNKTNQNSIVNISSPDFSKHTHQSPSRQVSMKVPVNQSNFTALLSQGAQYIDGVQNQNMNTMVQKYSQSKNIMQQQQIQNSQFSHIIGYQGGSNSANTTFKNAKDDSNFSGAGLLNMSKQRGMIVGNQHLIIRNAMVPAVRQSQNNNSQIGYQQSKAQYMLVSNQVQNNNNNKQILSKSPLYNVNMKQNGLNTVGAPNTQVIVNRDVIHQKPYARDINEYIANQNRLIQQQKAQFQYQLTNALNQSNQQYQIVNHKQHAKQLLAPIFNSQSPNPQQGYPNAKKINQPNQQQYGIYYYDSPVQINGKQFGVQQQTMPPQQLNQIPQRSIKKNGSERGFQVNKYETNLIQIFEQSSSLNNDEYLKQCILSEILDNQQDPTQILQSQDKTKQDLQQPQQILLKSKIEQTIASTTQTKPKSKIPFANAYVEDCYKFIVTSGNNSGLIKRAMERRDWWIEIPALHSMFNFKWQPVSFGIKFERLSPIKPKLGEIGSSSSNFGGAFSSYVNSASTAYNGSGGGNQSENVQLKQMVNHYEGHHYVSEKANLFNMLQKYCDLYKENIFDIVPITFYVEIPDLEKTNQYNQALQPFIQYYQCLEENKDKIQEMEEVMEQVRVQKEQEEKEKEDEKQGPQKDLLMIFNNKINKDQSKVNKFRTFNFDKRSSTKYSAPFCHFQGYNLWLLKPTHLNRGRGIHVFRDLETMHKLIREYCQGKDEELKTKKDKEKSDSLSPERNSKTNKRLSEEIADQLANGEIKEIDSPQQVYKAKSSQGNKKNQAYKIKHNTFIIQKYIEKPLLVCQRKFDIRVWVLLTQDMDIYVFKEGYLRTSSSEFHIDLKNIDDQYVHLTNNAVQKFSDNYGEFEDGNQLSYDRFQELLDKQDPDSKFSVRDHFVPQMHEQIIKSMYSVRKKLDPHKRKHCFELFGYDFILDADYNVWLIEVNTNPCIEESSQLLKMLLPRMVEDMLRLTIDVIFPKINKNKKKKGTNINNNQTQRELNSTLTSPVKSKNKIGGGGSSALGKIEEDERDQIQVDHNQSIENEGEDPLNDSIEKKENKKGSRIHPVKGYSDNENMWEKIFNLEKQDTIPNKYPNSRSEFLIQVNDMKQFKLKKNPLYKNIMKELIAQNKIQSPREGEDLEGDDYK